MSQYLVVNVNYSNQDLSKEVHGQAGRTDRQTEQTDRLQRLM